MTVAELVSRLVEAGATPEMIKIAVEAFDSQRVAYETMRAEKEAEEKARKQNQRERTARSRQKKKGVIADDAIMSRDGNVTGTLQSQHGNSVPPSDGSPKDITQTPSLPPTSSDADASAQPAGSAPEVSINDQIWNSKAALADLSGRSEEAVGKWIGKALKDHPPDVVKQGIDAALHAGTRDPFSYARSVMLNSRGTKNAQQPARNGRTYPAARPEGTAARVAALMGYDAEPEVHGPEEERRVPDRDAWPKGRHASGFIDAEPDAAGVYRA